MSTLADTRWRIAMLQGSDETRVRAQQAAGAGPYDPSRQQRPPAIRWTWQWPKDAQRAA